MSIYERLTLEDSILYNGKYILTSDFGYRILDGKPNNHKGMDFVGLENKEIISPVDGIVKSSTIITDKSNLTWQWGNYIRIDSNGKKYFFCHLSKRLVFADRTVRKGQIIGIEGETGYAYGSHLHLEIRNDKNISIDPKTIFHFGEKKGDENMKRYIHMDDVPECYQEHVKRWVEKGYIKGHLDGILDITEDMIRCLIITERMLQNTKHSI